MYHSHLTRQKLAQTHDGPRDCTVSIDLQLTSSLMTHCNHQQTLRQISSIIFVLLWCGTPVRSNGSNNTMSEFIFKAGPESDATSLCRTRSLTFCEEAHVQLRDMATGSVKIVGRAYETVDPLTHSGDSAPGYINKRGYSNAIGEVGVMRTLRVAFRIMATDVGNLQTDVCTSTGAVWHYMQATVQVFGATSPDRCSAVSAIWQSVTFEATSSGSSGGSGAFGGLSTFDILVIVLASVLGFCICLAVCGRPGAEICCGILRVFCN